MSRYDNIGEGTLLGFAVEGRDYPVECRCHFQFPFLLGFKLRYPSAEGLDFCNQVGNKFST
jgi:hypothetical protein